MRGAAAGAHHHHIGIGATQANLASEVHIELFVQMEIPVFVILSQNESWYQQKDQYTLFHGKVFLVRRKSGCAGCMPFDDLAGDS